MTQTQFAQKYDVTLAFISALVSEQGVKPIGRVQGKTKITKDYDEKELVQTVLNEYKHLYKKDCAKAEKWRDKYNKVKQTYKEGKTNGNEEVSAADC